MLQQRYCCMGKGCLTYMPSCNRAVAPPCHQEVMLQNATSDLQLAGKRVAWHIQQTIAKLLWCMQAMSSRSNAPECHIGSADRFRQTREGDFGTELLRPRSSIGLQVNSRRPSLPSYSLGISTRDQMSKVALYALHCWQETTLLLNTTAPVFAVVQS